MKLCNRNNIEACDRYMIRDMGYPAFTLMENAAQAFVNAFIKIVNPDIVNSNILILCGSGNNGGDGFAIARMLHLKRYSVRIQACNPPENYAPDTLLNFQLAEKLNIPIIWDLSRQNADLIIDAIAGTGIKGALKSEMYALLEVYKDSNANIIAVDLPSGLNADTGEVFSTPLKAQYTFTFHLPKICQFVYPAATYCGKVEVLDIGIFPEAQNQTNIPGTLFTKHAFKTRYTPKDLEAHKGSGGHVWLAAGQAQMPGAPVLSARSAFRAGAGKVTLCTPDSVVQYICNSLPEAMFATTQVNPEILCKAHAEHFILHQNTYQSVVIGPGIGTHPETFLFLQYLLQHIALPIILDADALNIIASHPELMDDIPENSIITPHPGEMKRLHPEFNPNQRLEGALDFATKYKCIVVLKGAGTVVAIPDGRFYVCPYGNPVLATAGSGDILSGIIGAFLAAGYTPEYAAILAVTLHAFAGDCMTSHNKSGITHFEAGELLQHLPLAMERLLKDDAKYPEISFI